MWIWPKKRFEIQTALPVREAISRVNRRTLEPQEPSDGADDMLFMGEVEAQSFVIRPVLMVQNAFAPRIQGQAEDAPQGCRISVTMGLHKATSIFMILWFILFGVLSVIRGIQADWPGLWFSLFMLGFGYVWMAMGFEREARRDRRLLQELLVPRQNQMQ